jgi:single-stranded-DNA-specific exonuclease
MIQPQPQWQVTPQAEIPADFLATVRNLTQVTDGRYAAQLLWQRGIRDPEVLPGFLDPDDYTPASPFEFGQEMKRAVQRLVQGREAGEKACIWGDFDADGITSTSVLWEGLGQFFEQGSKLSYYIPNRLTESHGLNVAGVERLATEGVTLIVTCDTGSTNLAEIKVAKELGIEIIVTDHHTLPPDRPDVTAIINPRYFSPDHPLFHLSGVAVAYKLVEALYFELPDIPTQPVEDLLDLVAIGLIADLVALQGDCRYLAQRGIQKLQQQTRNSTRPGVTELLSLCKRSGDRPTDISFGLGPRINAVSRIQGDARFCVELLTSRDQSRCKQLALETELANTRRKELQKDVTQQVKRRLEGLDLSTTRVIVLDDPQWQGGVLGLVASQIAQEYGRPTILLSTANRGEAVPLARGSARSVNNIDLYELVKSQEHLLHRFGGHPYAAGMSMKVEIVPLFREAINQQLRQQQGNVATATVTVEADLIVTVAELGQELFRELKVLEPCGMGNPVPKLLIKDCWFSNPWHNNEKDLRGRKVQYIKSTFTIHDHSTKDGFPGVWWGHYKDEIPQNQECDAVVELDFNTYQKRYEVRLIAVHSQAEMKAIRSSFKDQAWLLDWRGNALGLEVADVVKLQTCPGGWDDLQLGWRSAIATERKLALAYNSPDSPTPQEIWKRLIGIAKYLSRTQKRVTVTQLVEKLEISPRSLQLGLEALESLGFEVEYHPPEIQIKGTPGGVGDEEKVKQVVSAIAESQFRRQYFYEVPINTVEAVISQSLPESLTVGSYGNS